MLRLRGWPERAIGPTELRQMRRVCVAMFLVGGAICLSGVWTKQATPHSQVWQGSVAVALLATGLLVLVWRRPSLVVMKLYLFWAIVLLGLLTAGSDPLGMTTVFYLWPAVFSAYFMSVPVLFAVLSTVAVSLGSGLVLNPTALLKLDTFTGSLGAVSLMAVLVAVMTAREHRLRTELLRMVDLDPLTGLLNRRAFDPQARACVRDAASGGRDATVLLFDLDHFKRVNDTYGHAVGDRLLESFSGILRAHARADDLVCRFGGEEFVVVLPDSDAAESTAYVDRVASALAGAAVVEGYVSSFSCGISSLSEVDETFDALLARADEALYKAKRAGRARRAVWTPEGCLNRQFSRTEPAP